MVDEVDVGGRDTDVGLVRPCGKVDCASLSASNPLGLVTGSEPERAERARKGNPDSSEAALSGSDVDLVVLLNPE